MKKLFIFLWCLALLANASAFYLAPAAMTEIVPEKDEVEVKLIQEKSGFVALIITHKSGYNPQKIYLDFEYYEQNPSSDLTDILEIILKLIKRREMPADYSYYILEHFLVEAILYDYNWHNRMVCAQALKITGALLGVDFTLLRKELASFKDHPSVENELLAPCRSIKPVVTDEELQQEFYTLQASIVRDLKDNRFAILAAREERQRLGKIRNFKKDFGIDPMQFTSYRQMQVYIATHHLRETVFLFNYMDCLPPKISWLVRFRIMRPLTKHPHYDVQTEARRLLRPGPIVVFPQIENISPFSQ
jgi:hypothetical protein